MCEDEIDVSRENSLTGAWSTIKKEFPWYFEMRQLEGDRPSRVPNGLGNSGTEININLLNSTTPTASSEGDPDAILEDNGGCDDTTWHSPEWDYKKLVGIDSEFNPESPVAVDLDNEEENIEKQVSIKKGKGTENLKPTESSKAKKKTTAQPSISSPVVKPDNSASTAPKKSKNPADRFVEMAVKEEETAQLAMKFDRAKMVANEHIREQRQQAKRDVKIRVLELKSQERLALRKMDLDFKMREMEMRMKMGPETTTSYSPTASHSQFSQSSLWQTDQPIASSGPGTWSTSVSAPSSTTMSLHDEIGTDSLGFNFTLPHCRS